MADYPSTGPVKLRANLADSELVAGLKSGRVSSGDAVLEYAGPPLAHDGFKAMVRENLFDVGELAIVTYMQARAYRKPFIMLPAAVVGRFQHHCIGYNAAHGELKPGDLTGKRVGVRSYSQTTGVWVRGILQHEYGVDLDRVTWVCHEDPHLAEYVEPANVERTKPGDKSIPQMLLDGDVDAAILGNDMPRDPNIKYLIPNPHEAAKAWYEKYRAVPINHVFVVSTDLLKARPDVVRGLYRALQESKAAAGAAAGQAGGIDTVPFGYENVRKGLELAVDYAYEQKIIPHRLKVEELFDDTTRSL